MIKLWNQLQMLWFAFNILFTSYSLYVVLGHCGPVLGKDISNLNWR